MYEICSFYFRICSFLLFCKISVTKHSTNQLSLTTLSNIAAYLVLYTASAKDANALVFDRQSLDLEFFVECKTYVYFTDNKQEADYLAAILNSSIPNKQIKDFQTRGLFGPRDIHKKILDVYFPEFNAHNKFHLQLSELGKICAEKNKGFY